MGLTRRDFIKFAIGAGVGVLIASGPNLISGLDKLLESIKTVYRRNNPVNATETVTKTTTVTETETTTVTQAPQTYTTTTTVTETATQTETVTKTTTVTETETTTVTQAPQTYTTTTTQPPQNLAEILFGNSNRRFILLKITDAKIDNTTAYLTLVNPLTKTELQIELPAQYVSNGKLSIEELLESVNNYNSAHRTNYRVYFVLGRANIYQAIQQNGKWILPAPQIYYNIIISDRGWEDVYNALQNLWNGNATVAMPTSQQGPYANSLWGWMNGIGSVIIAYQNRQQVDSVVDNISLADYILGTPNDPNPSNKGILHVDTIADIQQAGDYNSGGNQYPVYNVNNNFNTYIVFIQEQGNQLFSNL